MRFITEFFLWTFKRLPRRFSIPLLVFIILFFLFVFPWLMLEVTPVLKERLGQFVELNSTTVQVVMLPVFSLITLLCALIGILVSYWLAVGIYRTLRIRKLKRLIIHGPVLPASGGKTEADNPFAKYEAIGIILAGGGAKGAYQAGAMKAVYEFLERYNAHHKVRMIAGTSIGSWNTLFWLADLIKEPVGDDGKQILDKNKKPVLGLLEQWWKMVDVQSVIRPIAYVPLRRNYFLSNEPWQESFNALFGEGNQKAQERLLTHIRNPNNDGSVCFYLTRSNVARARLEFTTNRTDLNVKANLPGERPRPPVPPGTYKVARQVGDIREAVFSSMDLPPLFAYSLIGQDSYEDGGVIDNLPIRFGTEIEQCDLLFVLPLNASFNEDVNTSSVVRRLFRVLNVRQGVLERNSFKMIYLYNELASLRDRTEKYEAKLAAMNSPAASGAEPSQKPVKGDENGHETADPRALKRRHKVVQVFSICPAPKLLINTADFWKTTEAGQAFQRMYDVTRVELEKFDFTAEPDWVRMALVGPHGEVTYLEDF
jgi:predicted acylesterase/phospholipase RssA